MVYGPLRRSMACRWIVVIAVLCVTDAGHHKHKGHFRKHHHKSSNLQLKELRSEFATLYSNPVAVKVQAHIHDVLLLSSNIVYMCYYEGSLQQRTRSYSAFKSRCRAGCFRKVDEKNECPYELIHRLNLYVTNCVNI